MEGPFARLIFRAALLATLALACSTAAAADAIVVSAAASLQGAFAEIGAHLAGAGGPQPAFNFGASGDLVVQIRGGAPVDVFASAAAKETDGLEAAGLLLPGTRVDFAANELVLVVPAAAGTGVRSFADLAQPAVARVAVANPTTSPAGRYAAETLASLGLAGALQPKLVPGETVRQVLDWVARGEVDAGLVFATDASSRTREVRVAAAAPPGSHRPIVYPIVALRAAAHPEAARAFIAAVRSKAGRAVLARHGFLPAPGDP